MTKTNSNTPWPTYLEFNRFRINGFIRQNFMKLFLSSVTVSPGGRITKPSQSAAALTCRNLAGGLFEMDLPLKLNLWRKTLSRQSTCQKYQYSYYLLLLWAVYLPQEYIKNKLVAFREMLETLHTCRSNHSGLLKQMQRFRLSYPLVVCQLAFPTPMVNELPGQPQNRHNGFYCWKCWEKKVDYFQTYSKECSEIKHLNHFFYAVWANGQMCPGCFHILDHSGQTVIPEWGQSVLDVGGGPQGQQGAS